MKALMRLSSKACFSTSPFHCTQKRLIVERRISNFSASTSERPSMEGIELVLGIESSCDDTGVALLRASSGEILGHSVAPQVIASTRCGISSVNLRHKSILVTAEEKCEQIEIHAPWGGVVPSLAMEAHRDAMDGTVQEVLRQAGVNESDLDAVAVTIGPGLSMCLKVGVLKAIHLAREHSLQYIPVHHMEAHALVARQARQVPFPFLCLLVSGGHNMLLLAHGIGEYTLLGTTLDDAVGEAFDKAARLLGLELRPNGGAALERLAKNGDPRAYPFTMPLKKHQDCNFSYAGLKTAVRLATEQGLPDGCAESNLQVRADIAASFQRVAIAHLTERCERGLTWALNEAPETKHLVVSGGVAANQCLRSSLERSTTKAGLELVCPPPSLCTDNGIMIAWAGIERLRAGFWDATPPAPLPGEEHLVDVKPRWPLTHRTHAKLRTQPRSQRKSRIFPSLTELTLNRKEVALAA